MITAVLAARSLLLNSLTVNQQLIKLCGIAHDIPTYRAYRMCFDLECSVAVQDRTSCFLSSAQVGVKDLRGFVLMGLCTSRGFLALSARNFAGLGRLGFHAVCVCVCVHAPLLLFRDSGHPHCIASLRMGEHLANKPWRIAETLI